ncbi:MAG: 2Fe-2S iron-sulfur cluster binding domain-containing protein [Steroidobacteraceae bacterium]
MSYELTIEPLGRSVTVEEGQTILDASLRAGIFLAHACGQGYCATCKVKVSEGEVDHGNASNFALMDYEREEGQTLACCATLLADTTIEADIEIDPDARDLPVRDHTGTVTRIVDLTPTIKGVWIRLDGEPMVFQAGQYVNFHFPSEIGHRAFSPANAPGAAELELHIRRVPGGRGTQWIHETLRSGDRVTVSGPYGRFVVRKSANLPSIFLAGGSGLSGPRSMILDLLAEGLALPLTLFQGARSREELYYEAEFNELAVRHPNFTYVPVLSDEPAGSAWNGRRQFVHAAAGEHFHSDFRGHKAYLCGPPLMIEACIATLMQGRLFERDIYTEKFFSAADAQQVRSPLFKRL